MRKALLLLLTLGPAAMADGQIDPQGGKGPFMISEDVSLAMNRDRILAAAQEAWNVSFALEPGGRITLSDRDNGLIEGSARVNYRSKMLTAREETMGTVSYQVTIQARNGQCHVRVHNLVHTGNRAARGGGINAGLIMEGEAPDERYEGVSLGTSRRIHTDIRNAAAARAEEVLRRFSARMRLAGGP